MIMFKCLRGSAPAYLAECCTSILFGAWRSALRFAVHGDIVVPSFRTDWGMRSFGETGSSSWNVLHVDFGFSSLNSHVFAEKLEITSN